MQSSHRLLPVSFVTAIVAAAVLLVFAAKPISAGAVCPASGALEGIDVSSFQGSVDWAKVAQAGKMFAYAKASEGAQADAAFAKNYAGIKSAGLKAGAYAFFRPAQDPVTQADFFVAQLRAVSFAAGDLLPALVVEITDSQPAATIAARLQTAANEIKAQIGAAPVIYTGQSFWDSNVGSTAFGLDPLWLASYAPGCPTAPAGWTTWAVWNYAANGTVNGISGSVDLDRSNGPDLPVYSPAAATPTPTATSTVPGGRSVYIPLGDKDGLA